MWYFYTFGLILNKFCYCIYVHVTSSLHKSDKFRGILLRIPVNCCAGRGTFVLCIICCLPTKRLPCKDAIIVTKKTIVSQVANLSCREEEFQRFPRRLLLKFVILDSQFPLSDSTDSSLGVHGLFVKCLRMLPELLRFAMC